jgi:hypothetical protein
MPVNKTGAVEALRLSDKKATHAVRKIRKTAVEARLISSSCFTFHAVLLRERRALRRKPYLRGAGILETLYMPQPVVNEGLPLLSPSIFLSLVDLSQTCRPALETACTPSPL